MIAYISLDEAIQKMDDLYRNDCIDYGASIPECFDNDRAINALKELPTVDLDKNWKTSGELEKGKIYIVTLNGSEQRDVDFCMWNGKEWGWAVDNVWNRNDDVIAWMDIPEPWGGGDSKDEREEIKWMINHLPSAQPERKNGEWILKKELVPLAYDTDPLNWDNYDEDTHSEWKEFYHCSECDWKSGWFKDGNYCKNCGADMREEGDAE